MKMRITSLMCGALALLVAACAVAPDEGQEFAASERQTLQKSDPRKIYVHLMPWFETPGFHWDKVGRHYNPQIGPYHSGDYKVIEYQLLLMKYSGIDGVIVDWPGRSAMYPDLPVNAENADQIIAQTAKFGMEFAVCFEDQYAADANDAINSMHWVKDHYFNQPNHIRINNQLALFVFGPQKLGAGDWPGVLSATGTDPGFFTLWYNDKAGGARDGTFGWIYSDGVMGVRNYYNRTDQGTKVPVLYPGFNAAYDNGAPGWSVPYDVEGDTFTTLWNAAKGVGSAVQVATWNDYTEGTMIEPTNEFGYKYLTALQKFLGVSYGQAELEIVRQLYDARKANNPKADAASQALNNFDLAGACAQLGCTAPKGGGSGGSSSGTAGSPPTSAGSPPTMTGGTGNNASGSSPTATGGVPVTTGGAAATAGTTTTDGGNDDAPTGGGKGCSASPPRGTGSGSLAIVAALLLTAQRRRRARTVV